jgi:hypothetical protein
MNHIITPADKIFFSVLIFHIIAVSILFFFVSITSAFTLSISFICFYGISLLIRKLSRELRNNIAIKNTQKYL